MEYIYVSGLSEGKSAMTELQTLKDLRHPDNKTVMGESYMIREDRLKQEAIKWIKEDIKNYRYADLHLPKPPVGINIHNFIVGQRQKWKDRFNITEEDLK